MKNAWMLGVVLAGFATGPATAAPLWAIANEVEGGSELLLADCGGDEAGECVRMSLACKGEVGSFGLSDGGALASRMIDRNDLADMTMEFRVGTASISVEAAGINLEPNAMDGGWWVTLPSYDMGALFAVIAERSDETVGATLAGETFDLTPRAEDREALREFSADCARP